MTWIEKHATVRADPVSAFADFQTVLVVALDYGNAHPPSPSPSIGNISRYALGDDYHDVLKAKLHAAADALRAEHQGLQTRAFVDAGPLNEKRIAEAAGLGFVGKHSNLIATRRGSYFFLGLLLVSEELPRTGSPDPKRRCGRCTDCIPACPTDAIIAPGQVDARRCLSYWTIEHRGLIPLEFRAAMGHRIFGCDDCQEVCPWNRFAPQDSIEAFAPRPGARTTDLATWIAIDKEEFNRRFRRSAVKRTKYEGFLRNCLIAAGNAKDQTLAPTLRRFLDHESPVLRGTAAWALSVLPDPAAGEALHACRETDDDPSVRQECAEALERMGISP